jgi:NitT/TauT family transport system substrate-binding protein
MDRRTFIGAAFSAISFPVMAMTGCSRSQPLRLGIHPWIGYETLYIAREFGWLSPDVVLHEGKIAGDSLVALKQGAVDAAALTLDEVMTARAAGVSLVVVLVFDVSAGADVVLARSDIGELKDIVGRRIGVEPSAVGEIMLARVLEAAGLEQKSVAKIDLPPDRQLEAWRQGLGMSW